MKTPRFPAASNDLCPNALLDYIKVRFPFFKWTFNEVPQKLETPCDPIYSAYMEDQFNPQDRLLKTRTVAVVAPKFRLFGLGFGLRVFGINYNIAAKTFIRYFNSAKARLLRKDPHAMEYQDVTIQGTSRLTCRFLVMFRSRQPAETKYEAASGDLNIPRTGHTGRVNRVKIKWTRIPETAILAAIGKTEMTSLRDVEDFIRTL
jgi:hypothetical protein